MSAPSSELLKEFRDILKELTVEPEGDGRIIKGLTEKLNSFDDIDGLDKEDCETHLASILKSATFLSHLEDCRLSSEKGFKAIMATLRIRRDYDKILSFNDLFSMASKANVYLFNVLDANGYKFYGILA